MRKTDDAGTSAQDTYSHNKLEMSTQIISRHRYNVVRKSSLLNTYSAGDTWTQMKEQITGTEHTYLRRSVHNLKWLSSSYKK